jgi:hypothetical protein
LPEIPDSADFVMLRLVSAPSVPAAGIASFMISYGSHLSSPADQMRVSTSDATPASESNQAWQIQSATIEVWVRVTPEML